MNRLLLSKPEGRELMISEAARRRLKSAPGQLEEVVPEDGRGSQVACEVEDR